MADQAEAEAAIRARRGPAPAAGVPHADDDRPRTRLEAAAHGDRRRADRPGVLHGIRARLAAREEHPLLVRLGDPGLRQPGTKRGTERSELCRRVPKPCRKRLDAGIACSHLAWLFPRRPARQTRAARSDSLKVEGA
ncbi:MAG: hypothetical protein R3C15_19780 [Thermoleophilia bacterium]